MFSTTKHRSDAMDNLGYRNGSQDINRHVLDKEDSPNLGLPWFVVADVCDIWEDFEKAKLNLGRQGEANIIN